MRNEVLYWLIYNYNLVYLLITYLFICLIVLAVTAYNT